MTPPQVSPIAHTVAFDEADGEGIVFFGNYFRLAHRALEAYLPQIGITWEDWYRHADWGVPLRHVEANYLSPLRPHDDLRIHVTVGTINESSVEFHFHFALADGRSIAKVKTVHVFVGRKSFAKMPIPEAILKRLQQMQ